MWRAARPAVEPQFDARELILFHVGILTAENAGVRARGGIGTGGRFIVGEGDPYSPVLRRNAFQKSVGHSACVEVTIGKPLAMFRIDNSWVGSNRSSAAIVLVRHASDRLMKQDHVSCVGMARSEELTSELQSRQYLVCRLLLEKKKE